MSTPSNGRMTRRGLLTAVAGASAGLALAACSAPAPAPGEAKAPAPSGQTFSWKLQSTWAAADFLQGAVKDLAAMIEEMSAGRLKIEVMAAGQVVPALEVLDTVHKGLLDAGHGSPAYWYGKHPATALFVGVPSGPYGMNYEDFLGWMYQGGGMDLYNELLQKELKLDVISFPSVAVPPEPLGWFNRPVQSLADFKGLKFRSAGMAAETMKEVGMSVVSLAGGEIVPSLERKVIDAAEWLQPAADLSIGFQDVAKYYYMPSTHQPLNCLELLVNRKKWEELPNDLKAIVRYATMANLLQFGFKLAKGNTEALQTLVDKHGVQVMETPSEVQLEIVKAWDRVSERFAREHPYFARVLASQKQWAEQMVPYRRVAHPPYELTADYYWKDSKRYGRKG